MKILIVDDNAGLGETLVMMFELMGHEGVAVDCGAVGLARLATFTPDCVLLDLGLPDMTGYDACKKIRTALQPIVTCVIAHSGRDGHSDIAQAEAAGFDHYLAKPASFEVLQQLLSRIALTKVPG